MFPFSTFEQFPKTAAKMEVLGLVINPFFLEQERLNAEAYLESQRATHQEER